uniref:Putative secreted protein n=1 Tax=Anopheles darlingi TaxID=43151 RepID=A0A2M4DQM8_ANODA
MVDDYVVRMSKLSISFFFIGLALLAVWTGPCDGSPLLRECFAYKKSYRVGGRCMLEEIRAQCNEIARISGMAFRLYMRSVHWALECMADFDTKKFKIDFNELTNATRGTFFPKYCDKLRSFVSCIDRSLMFMELCHSPSTIHIGKALIESISAVSNLACKNDGEIIFHEERKECIMQKEDEISACFNTFKKIGNVIIDFTELTQDQCSPLANFRRCLKDILDHCDLSDIVSVYDIPLNAMLSLAPCSNHTEHKVGLLENNSIDED